MRKPRILFVDDADEAVHPYQFYLEHAIPCDVVRASNGYEALESARRSAPDIVLLDLMMPEMDGFETCRRLREDLGLVRTPIIILTKKPSGGPDERRAFDVGADFYLHKPIPLEELTRYVLQRLEAAGFAIGEVEGG